MHKPAEYKTCTKCHKTYTKSSEWFYVKGGKYLSSECKECRKEKTRRYRIANIEAVKAKEKERDRVNNIEHRAERNEKLKQWRAKNPDQNKKWAREYAHSRRLVDAGFRIKSNMHTRILKAISRDSKSASTVKLIGCSIEQLKTHIENQFKTGMNWGNYGPNGWHIDHIRPCASFNLLNANEQIECFNFRNLQPLWAEENRRKGARVQ
jgi:hypothetical protein